MCGTGLTRANIPQTSLAINSGATIHFFCNQDLLQSIKATKSIGIHCGGTTFDYAIVDRFHNELKHLPHPKGKICITKDGTSNPFSLGKLVKEGYRVTMDSNIENGINIYNKNGSYVHCVCVCVCVCVQDGLYCINLDNSGKYTNFLATVSKQKDYFTDVDNKRAALARYIQEYLCLPSDTNLANAIDKGGIEECRIERRYIKIDNVIFGPAKAAVEEKSA